MPPETRAAETATVVWMLAVLITLVCCAGAATAWLIARISPEGDNLLLFCRYLHFCAIVTALLSLALMLVVLKTRREKPPTSITIFATIAALLPILAALL